MRAISGASPLVSLRLKFATLHALHAAMLDKQEVSGSIPLRPTNNPLTSSFTSGSQIEG